jgi:hypothetical protein
LYAVFASLYREFIRLPGLPDETFDQLTKRKRGLLKRMYERESNYDKIIKKEEELLDFKDFKGQVSIAEAKLFGEINNIGMSIFLHRGTHVYAELLPDASKQYTRFVELVLLRKEHQDGSESLHYTCATNFRKLFAGRDGYHKMDVCRQVLL